MPSKRTDIANARIDASVIQRLGEIMRPYMLPGLQSALRQTVELREEQSTRLNFAGESSDWELQLEEAVRAGGAWAFENVSIVDLHGVETSFDSVETSDLSFAEGAREVYFRIVPGMNAAGGGPSLTVSSRSSRTFIDVSASPEMIDELFVRVVEAVSATVPPPSSDEFAHPERPFKIFIAYGGGRAWEVVRDYLQAAGFQVDAFTEQERAGELTLDVVEQMIRSASVAVIVMTGADRMEGGAIHARQNVVHEAGFAQGAIGRRNTVILREAGVTLPTNVDGLTYIQFERGEIHTTKDRVVALVSRLKSLR